MQDLLRPDIFVEDGGLPPLHKIAAHRDDKVVCPCQSPGFAQEIGVPLMKGVAFHDDTCDFHVIPDFCQALQSVFFTVLHGYKCRFVLE